MRQEPGLTCLQLSNPIYKVIIIWISVFNRMHYVPVQASGVMVNVGEHHPFLVVWPTQDLVVVQVELVANTKPGREDI